MENKFYTDNFEQLLRETTDEFRMYPSRRVWHSLYNDLHPGKKWPSGAILLLLITSIMYIGVSNTKEADGLTANINTVLQDDAVAITPISLSLSNSGISSVSYPEISQLNDAGKVIDMYPLDQVRKERPTSISAHKSAREIKKQNTADPSVFTTIYRDAAQDKKDELKTLSTAGSITSFAVTSPALTSDESYFKEKAEINTVLFVTEKISADNKPQPTAVTSAKETMSPELKAWMDDFVFHNKRAANKWKGRLAYQVYATPSLGYRSFEKNTDYTPPVTNTLVADPQARSDEYYLNHSNAFNMEAGGNILINYSKRIRLKAGLQVNYTNYFIDAYELNHPTSTYILTNNPDGGGHLLDSRQTTLANTPGLSSRNLSNNTYQLSLPVGAEFKVAGKEKIKWYAGATMQPTFIASGHSYLISSDFKNYVNGDDLRRKFNLNGAVETYISYNTGNGVIVSAGPQFRYQFLSTYNKTYSYDEKLFNLGIKLGITRSF